MKQKTVVLAALAVAPACVLAQSTVQIYGVLDAGVNRVTGLAGGTQNNVVSGIMDGSRLGFKGSEDLGGGYRALFTMEHRLEVDTGGITVRPPSGSQLPDRFTNTAHLNLLSTRQGAVNLVSAGLGSRIGTNVAGNIWDRQVFVGLVTPFGGFLVGRQYTPGYEVGATFDTTATQSSLASGQIAAIPASVDLRVDNSVAYRIQAGPVSGVVMAAPGENSSSTGRFLGANVIYKTDAFSVGLGYNKRENELGETSLTSLILGGSVSLGPGTLVGSFGMVKDDHPTGLSTIAAQLAPFGAGPAAEVQNAYVQGFKQDARSMHVGYRLTTGPHTIYTAYTRWNDRRPADADAASYGAVYSYALSKRTDLNLALAHVDNKNLSQVALGQAGFAGGVTERAGTDSTSLAFGVRHRF
jgi:predicted porin